MKDIASSIKKLSNIKNLTEKDIKDLKKISKETKIPLKALKNDKGRISTVLDLFYKSPIRGEEINAIKLHIEESINMLVKSNTKESKKAIFDIYQVLAELMGTDEMNGYLKTICRNKSVKFEFNPLINNKPFNIEQRVTDIYKYISNI